MLFWLSPAEIAMPWVAGVECCCFASTTTATSPNFADFGDAKCLVEEIQCEFFDDSTPRAEAWQKYEFVPVQTFPGVECGDSSVSRLLCSALGSKPSAC